MAPLTNTEVVSLLLGSTHHSSSTRTYAGLLGIRRLSKSKGTSCSLSFTGVVHDFDSCLKGPVKEISQRFESRKEVQELIQAQGGFSDETVETHLARYGPKIWTCGVLKPFVTMLDGEDYPEHLVFEKEEDRPKIRTFVYCLVLQRACRSIKKSSSTEEEDTRPAESLHSSLRSAMNTQDGRELRYPNGLYREVLRESHAQHFASDERRFTQAPNDYHEIPVARMLPTQPDRKTQDPQISVTPSLQEAEEQQLSQGQRRHSPTPTYNIEQASRETPSGISAPEHVNALQDQASGNNDNPRVDLNRKNMLRKRRRSTVDGTSGASFRILRASGRTQDSTSLRRMDVSSWPAHISIPDLPSDEADSRSEDNRHDDNYRSLDAAILAASGGRTTRPMFHGLPLGFEDFTDSTETTDDRADIRREISSEDEEDSETHIVHSSPDNRPTVIHSPSGATEGSERLTFIVRLKLNFAAPQLRIDRKRLALTLPRSLCLNERQSDALATTLDLIIRLREAGIRAKAAAGRTLSPYQQILGYWLEFVGIFMAFRQTTAFYKDKADWEAHLKTLDAHGRCTADEPRLQASIQVDEWRLRCSVVSMDLFARDVTNELINTAVWIRDLDTNDRIERRRQVKEFNQSIVVWFQ